MIKIIAITFLLAISSSAFADFSRSHLKVGNINLAINNSGTILTKTDASTGKWLGEQKFREFQGMLWVPSHSTLFVSGVLSGGNSSHVVKIRNLGGEGRNMFAVNPNGTSAAGYNYVIGNQKLRAVRMSYNGHLMLRANGKSYHMKGICGSSSNMCALKNNNQCRTAAPRYNYFDYCD
mgnify:CR=1 FL=1